MIIFIAILILAFGSHGISAEELATLEAKREEQDKEFPLDKDTK